MTLSMVKPFGAVETERIADRQGGVADLHAARVAEGQGRQLQAVGGDAQEGEVVGRVAADHLGVDLITRAELDGHLHRSLHHVPVGEDRPVLVHHDARAAGQARLRRGAAATTGAKQVERRGGLRHERGADVDHAGRVALVDLVSGQRLGGGGRGDVARGRHGRGLVDHGGRLGGGVADAGDQDDRGDEGAAEDGGHERGAQDLHGGQDGSEP